MNATLIAPEVMQRLAGSLLHFIWQGAIIAIFAAIGLRLLRRRSAEARYAVAITALVGMLAAPMFTLVFYAETGAVAQKVIQLVQQASTAAQAGAARVETAAWAQQILTAWCIGVALFAARLIVGWRLSWQLVKSAEDVIPQGVMIIFETVKQRLDLRREVRLVAHARLDSPVVVGWLRPVVLLPLSLISGFTEEQLIATLAHELAHIRRHDFMVNILQRCVESILFYHPAVWWLSKRIRAEREHCCDDVAVQICGSRKAYAEALIVMERARQTHPPLAVAATDGVVLNRFRRVLGLKTSALDWQSAVGMLVFLGVWIVVGMWQSSSALQATPVRPPAPVAAAILPATAAPTPVVESVNAIAAILTAQPIAEPQAATTGSTVKGSIQGVVTRSGSSAPIPGATVGIINAPFDPDALKTLLDFFGARGLKMDPQQPGQSDEKYFQSFLDTLAAQRISAALPDNQLAIDRFRDANTAKYSTVADANGRFTIKDLPPGKYTVEGGLPGFFAGPADDVLADVEAGKPADIVLPLAAGATITGRVKNASGKALPNVTVTAYAITYQNGKIIPDAEMSDTSDDHGDYRMFWLPPADYVIVADPPRYPVTPTGPPLRSDPPPTISVAQGTQILSTPQAMKTFYPQALTTADARILTVKGGELLSGMDITMQKGVTYKVTGEVRGIPASAIATPQARIQGMLGLEYRDPTIIDMRSTTAGGSIASPGLFVFTPSADGYSATYELTGVLPGEYYIVPRINQTIPPGGGNVTINRYAVDVIDRDVTNLNMELFKGSSISGTVTIDGRPPGSTTIRVSFQAVGNPSPVYQGIGNRPVVASADGTFSSSAAPTHYRVELGAGVPPELYLADVRQGALSIFETGFEVGKGVVEPIQVMLRSGGSVVEGIVRDAAGKPVRNSTVVVIPPESRRLVRTLYKTATSDATGHFTVRGIAPGTYKIYAWPNLTGGEFYNARFLSNFEFRGKSINVTQGSTVTESLTLIDGN